MEVYLKIKLKNGKVVELSKEEMEELKDILDRVLKEKVIEKEIIIDRRDWWYPYIPYQPTTAPVKPWYYKEWYVVSTNDSTYSVDELLVD